MESGAALVQVVVVSVTDEDEDCEIGATTNEEREEVVGSAAVCRNQASGDGTGWPVACDERSSLVGGGDAPAPAEVEDHGVAAQHDRDQVGVAREPSGARGRDRPSADDRPLPVELPDERVVVDDDDQLGP